MKLNKYFLTIILIFATVGAEAQMAKMYTSGSGLPSSQINSIYQDSAGFIWISTENGLAKFDGMDFSTIRVDRDNTNSIASDFVLNVFEDSFGTYWVGTSAGLQIFDEEYNSFTKINLNDKEVPSSSQHISDIIQVKYKGEDKILVSTSGHGLYVIDPSTRRTDDKLRNEIREFLPYQFIRKMFADSQGRLWIGTQNGGLGVIELATGKDITPSLGNITEIATISSFVEDRVSGNIILGCSNNGILVYENSLHRIRRAKGTSARSCRVESMLRNTIAPQYGDNTILVGVENGGIMLFDMKSEKVTEISIPNIPYNISSLKVHSLTEDNQGNVWVGAYQTGIIVIPKSMFGFEYKNLNQDGNNIAIGACVTSIIKDSASEDFWIGTDGTGIFRAGKDGRITNYTSSNSSLPNNSVLSLAQDKRGTIWIATYLDGLVSWSPKTGFRKFRNQEQLKTDRIASLAYSYESDILFVGTHGNGLSMISLTDEKVIKTYADDNNKWISDLYIDKTGLLWVGTYNGPMCYDHRVKDLIKYRLDESLKTRVQCFCESSDGKMWIGTGEGLVCYDRDNEKTTTYTENEGLPNNVVNSILEGIDGNLWMGTSNGLSRFNPTTGKFQNYYHHDGLQENEFNARAAYIAEDGKLYFGGINGVTSFYPHIVDQKKHPVPPLYFSDLRVMNEPVAYNPGSEEENVLDRHISKATQITLPKDKNMFSIKFSVLEYTNPLKITYDYMLEGFNNDWQHIRSFSRRISYTNLPAGRYTLKVKAFFDGYPEDYSYREIGIRILPPWYLSTWALLLYIALAGLAYLGYANWKKKMELRKKELEESEIKEMKLQMFTNISHEIRTPLTLVMNPLKKMRESEDNPKQKELYNLMYRNSLRILRLVNQLLDMRKVDSGQMQLHFLETDVVYFIRDIMKSFDNLAVSNNIHFSISPVNEVTNLWIDQGNFDKIIFNILSNAFKYTPENGSVSIHISGLKKNDKILDINAKEYIEFVIENSGSSVDERYLDRLFDRFFQTDVKDAKIGSGVGLNLSKMLVELHHGDIRAYNTDEGVAFSIRIPAGNSHLTEEELTKPTNHKDLYTKTSTIEEHSESREDVTYTPAKEEEHKKQVKSKKNIVLVDDDSEMRAYLKLELETFYNIETCKSGKEAWAKISTTHPDAVVTDFMMEGMNGAELCEKVKKNPETNLIPVIILTSSHDENSQQRCIDSGADRYLTKPVSLEILKSSIVNAISTRDTMRNKYREIDYKFDDIKMSDSSNKLVTKVIEVIRANIENSEFGVEDLSREVGMSRVHLNRKLKEIMNISPSNLIKSIRLKQAAYLLLNNDVNISEVAYKVGFSTHSYFSNSFHDYFGMTPKEFVAKYQNCKDEETIKQFIA